MSRGYKVQKYIEGDRVVGVSLHSVEWPAFSLFYRFTETYIGMNEKLPRQSGAVPQAGEPDWTQTGLHGRQGGTLDERQGLHDGRQGLHGLAGGHGPQHGRQRAGSGSQGQSGGHGRYGGHGAHAGTHGMLTLGSLEGSGGKFSWTDVVGRCDGRPG